MSLFNGASKFGLKCNITFDLMVDVVYTRKKKSSQQQPCLFERNIIAGYRIAFGTKSAWAKSIHRNQ